MVDALIPMPGKGLALPSSTKGGGLALINNALDQVAEPLHVLSQCQQQCKNHLMRSDDAAYDPKAILNALLPDYPRVLAARNVLWEIALPHIFTPEHPLTEPMAIAMLGVLFGALAKRSPDDESAATLLTVCADMFNPTNSLGNAVARHPAILAIAIKRILAREKWAPAPCELRAEIFWVRNALNGRLAWWVEPWIEKVEDADAKLFTSDRKVWANAYRSVHSCVAAAMQEHACAGEEPEEDEEGMPVSGTCGLRWQALDELVKAKRAEEVAQLEAKQQLLSES
jgi:hypothetical protein